VRDRTPAGILVAPSSASFHGSPAVGVVRNVREAANCSLSYSLSIPVTAANDTLPPAYDVDQHGGTGKFTRIACYLEIQKPIQPMQFCWVSMDPFTADTGKIGVPYSGVNAFFQRTVKNMNVASNVPGVRTGTGLGGNLEFWSTNYGRINSAHVTGASDATFDFGDQPARDGQYGSMQIHNPSAGQTLLAFNRWGNAGGAVLDVGIGNSPGGEPDWTLAGNADGYPVRTLQAYVLYTGPADLNGGWQRRPSLPKRRV
jgi:sialate O-acetylesterase